MKIYTTDELRQMPSDTLDRLLSEELDKKELNGEYILTISGILEDREADLEIPDDERIQTAWDRYQAYEHTSEATVRTRKYRRWISGIAAAAAVLAILVIGVPTAVGTENVSAWFMRMGHELIEFFNPDNDADRQYNFQTDHPGLQQIYDAAVELGFEDPPVPKWMPEGFELVEMEVSSAGQKRKIEAAFSNGEYYILLMLRESSNTAGECPMDDGWIPREFNRLEGYIFTNEGIWTAVGVGDGLELVAMAPSEDALYNIMNSVYTG